MDSVSRICILTPVYNRAEAIKRLYASLLRQTSKEFVWLVIDDGSTDGTCEWFERTRSEDCGFIIRYYLKEHGGKHTALNFAHELIQEEYVVVVDSDDELTPSAVQEMLSIWAEHAEDSTVAGVTFQRGRLSDGLVLDQYFKGVKRSTYANELNSGMSGDHCETFRRERFCSCKFPVFEKEQFVGEGAMWFLVSKGYDVIYSDSVVYLCEYRSDGLTKSGRAMRVNNPWGGMWHANTMTDPAFKPSIRIKNMLLFDCYAVIAKCTMKEARLMARNGLLSSALWPMGVLLGSYWKKRYVKGNASKS